MKLFWVCMNKTDLMHRTDQQKTLQPLSYHFIVNEPFNSQRLLTINFSLQYSCTIQQTGNENTKMYQVEVVILIYH